MRQLLLTIMAISAGSALAQNWSLLNPTYRYNFSDGGPDTISDQIFITDVATLGADSFHYELNKIVALQGVFPSYGDPSWPTRCVLDENSPTFLKAGWNASSTVWRSTGNNEVTIYPKASVGTSWNFDPIAGSTINVVDAYVTNIWGQPDSAKLLVSTLGDSIEISKSLGVLTWHMANSLRYWSVGIHGPDLGLRIPTLHEMYAYQPGDVVQYTSSGQAGGGPSPQSITSYVFLERTDGPGTIHFKGVSRTKDNSGGATGGWNYYGPDTLDLDIPGNRDFDNVMLVPPKNLVRARDSSGYCISGMGTFDNGEYRVKFGELSNDSCWVHAKFLVTDTMGAAMYSYIPSDLLDHRMEYQERIGFRRYYVPAIPAGGFGTSWRGAIINGDTLGSLDLDSLLMPINEVLVTYPEPHLFPVPASDVLNIQLSADRSGGWSIIDLTGRALRSGPMNSSSISIDVRHLPEGTYFLNILEQKRAMTKKFIIAR